MQREDTEHLEPLQNGAKPCHGSTQDKQDVETLYSQLGSPGRFQTMVFVMMAITWLSVSSNMVAGVFFAFTPNHVCHPRPSGAGNSVSVHAGYSVSNGIVPVGSSVRNLTSTAVLMHTNNMGTNNMTLASCTAIIDNATYSCSQGDWQYDLQEREATAVSDFDLVCDRTFFRYLANTLFYIGIMTGSFIFGYLSDVLGRRPVVMATIFMALGLGVAIFFVEDFAAFVFLRFMMGVTTQGLLTSTFILLVEQFSCPYRGRVGAGIEIFWSLGVLYLSAAAWIALDWRYIQLAIVAPLAVAAVYVWFLPESIRWLLAKGKTHRASRVVHQITWFNKLPNPVEDEDCLQQYCQIKGDKTSGSYLDLLRVPELRKRAACMGFICFAGNVGYFGMTFNSAQLAGNRYLNFFLGSIVEMCAMIMGTVIVSRFGRKKPLTAILSVGSLCCLVAGVFPRGEDGVVEGTAGTVVAVFSVLGRAVMCMNFCIIDLYPSELFPTVIRNMGVGVCAFMGRLGAVVTPPIFSLADQTFPQLPPLIFCALTVTAALLTCVLPETANERLPDTVIDVQLTSQSSKRKHISEDNNGVLLVADSSGETPGCDVGSEIKDVTNGEPTGVQRPIV